MTMSLESFFSAIRANYVNPCRGEGVFQRETLPLCLTKDYFFVSSTRRKFTETNLCSDRCFDPCSEKAIHKRGIVHTWRPSCLESAHEWCHYDLVTEIALQRLRGGVQPSAGPVERNGTVEIDKCGVELTVSKKLSKES